MKSLISLVFALLITAPAIAQHDHTAHTNKNPTPVNQVPVGANAHVQKQLVQLLGSYYNIKNALVAGDASSAATNAGEFLRTVNSVDYKVLLEGNVHILGKDAGRISTSKVLGKQREYFAALSENFIRVARMLKIGDQPVYVQYCPMKKASWLSSEKEIRNPYYGSEMLTCGEITETL